MANPQKLVSYAHLLAELQVDMHTRTASKLPLQRSRLQQQIQEASGLTEAIKVHILTKLDQLQDDNVICHGDLHPENILLTAEEPVIIDWVDGTQGNPLADVARTTILLRFSELPPHISEPHRQKITQMRHLFSQSYLERYTQIRPVSHEAVARWKVPTAAARLTEGISNHEKAMLMDIIRAALV